MLPQSRSTQGLPVPIEGLRSDVDLDELQAVLAVWDSECEAPEFDPIPTLTRYS